ncbi:MAG: endonuclease/exonuclease/phosphatase family protein [Actinomycetes bacterium]
MRLLTYNVRSLRDDKVAVAAVIRACDADVVCIQEAPRFLRWRSKCAALARESGMFVVTGGRVAGAMLLLARLGVDVEASYDVLLQKTPHLHQRGLAVGVLRVKGERYAVASMHLSLEDTERTRQVDEVISHMERVRDGAPIVLAGDVNETPDRPRWEALSARFTDAFTVAPVGEGNTYSAARPYKRIDGIFVDPDVRVLSCGVPDVPGIAQASDHCPLVADLRLS